MMAGPGRRIRASLSESLGMTAMMVHDLQERPSRGKVRRAQRGSKGKVHCERACRSAADHTGQIPCPENPHQRRWEKLKLRSRKGQRRW